MANEKDQTNTNNANQSNAKAGFLDGFNWKHNAIVGTLTAVAAAGAMYFLSGNCNCDVPPTE